MRNVILSPTELFGSVTAPPSKSDAHRAIICGALSKGICKISPISLSNDIKATIGCIEALGASTHFNGDVLTIDGTNLFKIDSAHLDCGESGSTLRFFVPIAAAGGVNTSFTGHGSLPTRPMNLFMDILPPAGVECDSNGFLPIDISGQLKSGRFEVPGNISSQYISGLLFALPLLEDDSEIILTSPMESVGYINMTINTMSKFGVNIETTENGWFIKGGQSYNAVNYTVEGDWSQAAFFMVAGAISGNVTVKGVTKDSYQGDKKIAELLQDFGATVDWKDNEISVRESIMTAIEEIDASQIPDLVPVLAVCATFAQGTTKIVNAERLRIKESDRLASTAKLINDLGGQVQELEDGLVITGVEEWLQGGKVEGFNDHRIVMSAAVCATGSEEEIECTDAQSINKSYPVFFEDYNSIGGRAEDVNVW